MIEVLPGPFFKSAQGSAPVYELRPSQLALHNYTQLGAIASNQAAKEVLKEACAEALHAGSGPSPAP
jgi:hypothetical protein